MWAKELKVNPSSDYYVYSKSALASRLYFYPICIGYFQYEPGYKISRKNYDSFLVMCITKGSCQIEASGQKFIAKAGTCVLIDCYEPHAYGSDTKWEASWMHFDGPIARNFYGEITANQGNVLIPNSVQNVKYMLKRICDLFRNALPIDEAEVSNYIIFILNDLLASRKENKNVLSHSLLMAECLAYINEHFRESISLEDLSRRVNLSLYHFIRIFTKETGVTPHQYIINIRLTAAKFLLKSQECSIKEIAFSTGFNSESSFCSTFKKWEKVTPSEYRNNGIEK